MEESPFQPLNPEKFSRDSDPPVINQPTKDRQLREKFGKACSQTRRSRVQLDSDRAGNRGALRIVDW